MKRIILVCLALCINFLSLAQSDKTKIDFKISNDIEITESLSRTMTSIHFYIKEYLYNNGYVFALNQEGLNNLTELEDYNEYYCDVNPVTHQPIMGGTYILKYVATSQEACKFVLEHDNLQGSNDFVSVTDSYPLYWIETDNGQKLAAYELIKKAFGLKEDGEKQRAALEQERIQFEETRNLEINKERKKYTALSFLPPVNQFRSHTSKGTANGIAIVSGYTVSIGGLIWSTVAFNGYKRSYDNVSVDLTEADKARKYYKDKMDFCRGGQIASGIVFLGSYVYGVVNALTNREAYQNHCTNVSFAPIAYDNGAGIALVYNF